MYIRYFIILMDGIGGEGRYCTLVSVSMILFYFCVGWGGRYPVFIRLGIPV